MRVGSLVRLTPLLFTTATQRVRAACTLSTQSAYISAFRARIQECNAQGPLSVPFFIGNDKVGEVRESLLPLLGEYPETFDVDEDSVRLAPALITASLEERSRAVARVMEKVREAGFTRAWYDESLAIATSFDAPPALLLERGCVPLFGAAGYGVFVNGYSTHPDTGETWLWVATRSASKQNWPGMLDVLVAGAQPAGLSPSENVVKEAQEEAGMSPELAQSAVPVGCVSYKGTDEWGNAKRDVLFCYDLEVPWDFEPVAVDGEVESFTKMQLTEVANAVAHGKPALYKPNCNLVVIDFLVRRGFITPDSPGYLQMLAELRCSGDCR